MKILIIEDNAWMASLIVKGLTEAGHVVDHADSGRDGIFLAGTEHYDAIILDRMLPDGVDGIVMIETLRSTGNMVPILIVSGLTHIDERILGLRAGADDYLVKPFAFGELLARVDALIRRSKARTTIETKLTLGNLTMDLLSRQVMHESAQIMLKPREFKLLEYFMRHANQIVTRTMLLENVWNYDFDPKTNVIDVHVGRLRRKIEANGRPMLKTIRNVGYMLTADSQA